MTLEHDSSSPQKPPWISAEFFTRDPRAADIRQTCILAANTFSELLHNTGMSNNERSRSHIRLDSYNGRLIELGIRKGMHSGVYIGDILADPVMTAEWVAEQVQDGMGSAVPSADEIRRYAQEFGESDKRGVFTVRLKKDDLQNLPPKLGTYIKVLLGIGRVYDYFSPTNEEKESS